MRNITYALGFFLCIQGWCEFPSQVERQWQDLETVLCHEKAVAIYIVDREQDPILLSKLQQTVFEIVEGQTAIQLEQKEQDDRDLTLAIIVSREEEFAHVTMFMAGEDYEEEGKPYFLDCFQVHKNRLFDEIVIHLRQRILELKGCGGSLKPYIAIDNDDQF